MKTKQIFQNINLGSILSSWSNRTMTMHLIKREWRTAIIFSSLLKFLTMVFSVFAGFGYVNNIMKQVSDNDIYIMIFTISILIILEFMTSFFLRQTFKFSFRQRFVTASASFAVVLIFFTASFIASTEGLANRQSDKKDNSKEIIENTQLNKDSLIKIYIIEKSELQTQIETIKKNPQGWVNGQPSRLRTFQLNDIKKLENKKDTLKRLHKNELKELQEEHIKTIEINKKEQTASADKYYKIMTANMLLQLFSTAILIYFLHLIQNQEQPNQVIKETFQHIEDTIKENGENILQNAVITANNRITEIVETVFKKFEFPESDLLKNTQNKALHTSVNQTQKILGFGNKKNINQQEKNELKTDLKNIQEYSKTSSYPKDTEQNNNQNLEYLNKHKKLVFEIKNLQPQLSSKISNQQIIFIQENTPKNIQKSKSLIQRIFLVMHSIGINKIEKSGNLIVIK